MNLIKTVANFADKFFRPSVLYAHCDVPCGIYETDSMLHAVETVKAMTEKILALEEPTTGKETHLNFHNTLARMIATKEEFAQRCKTEILILWTDYFKIEHLSNFPNLHEHVWKTTKLCSDIKREVNMEKVTELEKNVKKIAKFFADSKK